MLQDNETKKRNDAARRTLVALLSQDKAINAKIREAKYDVEKAQKKLQNLQKQKRKLTKNCRLFATRRQRYQTQPPNAKSTPTKTATPNLFLTLAVKKTYGKGGIPFE